MQERLESLFGLATPGWSPPVDLAELHDRYLLTIELPGLSRSDVHLEYLEPVLTIRGKRPAPGCCPERYQQLERGHGEFARAFRFEHPVHADQFVADITDGVLTVTIPKRATPGTRIEVK